MLTRQQERGDTLIEVMLAIAIFTVAAVSTITILNQGVAISQRSLEKSLVRQQIDSQAEIIRYIRMTNDPAWQTIVYSHLVTQPLSVPQGTCPSATDLSAGAVKGFFVTKDTTGQFAVSAISSAGINYQKPATYAQIDYTPSARVAKGMWVQVMKAENISGSSSLDAYDFYINACWDSIGVATPMTLGTIVRLYGQ